MKKYLKFLLALLLFVPILVSAQNVTIKSVEMVEKKGFVEEVSSPKYSGLKIEFDLKFYELGDQIKYQLDISNGDNEDYVLDTKLGVDSEYIEYSIDNSSTVIKAGTDTKVYVIAKYKTEVPTNLLTGNKYNEIKNIRINLVSGTAEEMSKYAVNPKTGNPITIIVFGLALAVGAFIILRNKKIRRLSSMVIALGLILIPTTIMALKSITIDVDSKVEIERINKFEFTIRQYNGILSSGKTYQAVEGMTWEAWLNSPLNVDNIKLDDITGIGTNPQCKSYNLIIPYSRVKGVDRGFNDIDRDSPNEAFDYEAYYRSYNGVFPKDLITAGETYISFVYNVPCVPYEPK